MLNLAKFALPVVLVAIVGLFLLEQVFPLRKRSRPLGPRLLVNALLSLATYATAAFTVRPASLSTMSWGERNAFGLFHGIHLPPGIEFVLGFILLDLSFYYWHRLNHVASFLWRFHNVHHFDPDLDVSTAFRFHFGEVFLSTAFRLLQIALLGVSLRTFLVFELVFQLETYFQHSNTRMPSSIERLLNFLLVTPRMHGIHHSRFHKETDSNYSVIFSLWDRLHGSFRWDIPQSEITIGVPGYSSEKDNRFINVLAAPFKAQHDYWCGQEERR